MKKLLNTKWFLLSISFLSAVIIWIYVVYQINPTFETTIKNVPITYIRYSEEFENGKIVLSSSSHESANIRIKGKRTLLSKVSRDDINCTVDMSSVTSSGTHRIPLNVSFNVSGIELVSKDPYSLNAEVEDVVTKEIEISIDTIGVPAEGYIYDSVEHSLDKVRISGARGLVSKVKKVEVKVDISDKTESRSGRYKIILKDKDGNEIDEKGITKNISYIEVKYNITSLKEVRIEPQLSSSKNAQGNKVTATVTPETVKILGSKGSLVDIEEILTKPINVRNIKDKTKLSIELEELPKNVKIEKDIKTVEVTITIE